MPAKSTTPAALTWSGVTAGGWDPCTAIDVGRGLNLPVAGALACQ
jgi:hypothetical protein